MTSLMPDGQRRSRSGLARLTGVSRQQLTQWFEGTGEPRMAALDEAARALGVRRVDLVAAYDGVDAPTVSATDLPQSLEARLVDLQAAVAALQVELSDGQIERAMRAVLESYDLPPAAGQGG